MRFKNLRNGLFQSAAALSGLSMAGIAAAEVGLRVDARPLSRPIEAYVLATNDDGEPLDLSAEELEVRLDGSPIRQFDLKRPPRLDSTQHISVVIVARTRIGVPPRSAGVYSALIRRLEPGDRAAVVLLGYGSNFEMRRIYKASILTFREIDGGANSDEIVNFLETGRSALATVDETGFRQWLRGTGLALDEFARESANLPVGPRAIVDWDARTDDMPAIVRLANVNGVSIFSRHQAPRHSFYAGLDAKRALAENSGGVVVQLLPGTGSAMPAVESWLKDGYRLTIPTVAARDCELHMLEVTVRGQLTSTPFSRCDAIPEPIEFLPQLDVEQGSVVVSYAQQVQGIESPASVSIYRGEYSIGCGQTFTSTPGYVEPGQAICVRHQAGTRPGKETTTVLVIGGVVTDFRSHAAL